MDKKIPPQKEAAFKDINSSLQVMTQNNNAPGYCEHYVYSVSILLKQAVDWVFTIRPHEYCSYAKKAFALTQFGKSSKRKMAINTVSVAMYCVLVKIMSSESWLERLEMLLMRFSHLGIRAEMWLRSV